jgi:hypothetical protein
MVLLSQSALVCRLREWLDDLRELDSAVVLLVRTWAAVGYMLFLLVLRKRLLGPDFVSAATLILSTKLATDSHFLIWSSRAIFIRRSRGNCSADDFFCSLTVTAPMPVLSMPTLMGFSGRKSVPNTAQFRTKPVMISYQSNDAILKVCNMKCFPLHGIVLYEI